MGSKKSLLATTDGLKMVEQLEALVDELVKSAPHESRIRTCMEAVGLKYTIDPIERMNSVLATLDGQTGGRSVARNRGKEA